ncbi:MAG: hypothetical protein NTY53_23340 [Kiritimatiellaeota bacterium]|nr:hypothetical protein [Kiritimatiellota bacterium]
MADAPKVVETKLGNLLNAWTKEAPTATFAGMTLAQFKAKVQPSLDARQQNIDLGNDLTTAEDNRDDADKVTMATILLVINAIKGDPNFGEDSPLYDTAGYVRKSERSSGKTNKTKPTKTP